MTNWIYVAVVDPLDLMAVLALIRTSGGAVEELVAHVGWRPSPELAAKLDGEDPPLSIVLNDEQVRSVIAQIGPPPTTPPTTEQAVVELAWTMDDAATSGRHGSITFAGVTAQWLPTGKRVRVELVAAGTVLWSRDAASTERGLLTAAEAVVAAFAARGVTNAEIIGALTWPVPQHPEA